MLTKSLYYIKAQDREILVHDGLTIVNEFLRKFENVVPEYQRFDALKWPLHMTPVWWCGTHEGTFTDWRSYKRMMQIRFAKLTLQLTEKYDGRENPHIHLRKWTKAYGEEWQPEWVHLFYHTLYVIQRNWYTETELQHGTGEWDILHERFLSTFLFEDQWMDTMENTLKLVKTTIFKLPLELEEVVPPDWSR